MKTAEQMREEAAKMAENLEARWRASADKQQALYDTAWIGGHQNRQNARWMYAAADGLRAVAACIRTIPLDDQETGL